MTSAEPNDPPSDAPQERAPLDPGDVQRLKRVRWVVLAEFIAANLLSVAVAALCLVVPAQVDDLRMVWFALVLPAMVGGVGLLTFHARIAGRPINVWLLEAATWAVFPVTALATTFVIPLLSKGAPGA